MNRIATLILCLPTLLLSIAAFAYLRRLMLDILDDLAESIHPLKVILRGILLALTLCAAIGVGLIIISLSLTLVAAMVGLE